MSIQLQLENTSTCNASCVFCPYPSAGRWGGLMDMDLFKKILGEAASIPLITEICITGLGEPTLDPHLVERVAFARSAKPKTPIAIYTNGVFLSPAKFDALCEAGLSRVVFSLNAVSPKQHASQMGLRGKFDLVCSNIDHALSRSGVETKVHAVFSSEWSLSEIEAFYERWGHVEHGGHGQLVHEGNWADDNRTTYTFKPNEACHRALGQIYVLFDGRVTPCCFKPSGDVVFGDLRRQTLREIYASQDYVAFRTAHALDKADRYDFCKTCTRI